MIVTLVLTALTALTAVFEAQNENRLRRWLGKCYIGGEKLVSKAICLFQGALRIFENMPPPQSGPCLMLKKGLFSRGYGNTSVHMRDMCDIHANTLIHIYALLASVTG